jgi:predicted AAA+ superfamily ATPase
MAIETLIDRPEYIRQLKAWQGQNDLIKIVTGVRRCGKSKLFELFQTQLQFDKIADDDQIVSINLEDLIQTQKIGLTENSEHFLVGYEKLLDYILAKLNPQKMNFVFIDEVQLLRDWQKVANALRLQKNVDVYLTGSNAYMFSSDLANSLGGRYVEIKMQPLSFLEYYMAYRLTAGNTLRTRKDFLEFGDFQATYEHYIRESGFPQTLKMLYDRQHISDYLRDTVYLNTVQKDIVKRFNIADTNKLDAVVKYMFDNIGNETSVRSIERGLSAGGHKISVPTIDRIIEGLLDSFLMYKCDRYDIKGKQYLDSNSKYYVADIGLRTALIGMKDMDAGHILENVVYLELIRRGYEVTVGKIHKGSKLVEVDFVAKKSGGIVEYYQVALNVIGTELLERELAPLKAIEDNYPKFLLTMDYGSGENDGIKRLNVLDWLLGKE